MNPNFGISHNPKNDQIDLYNKLIIKDYSSPPTYSKVLDVQNSKISKNHLPLIQNLSKITNFVLISPLEIIYKEQYGIFTKTTMEREKCPICLCEFYDDIIEDNKNFVLKDIKTYTEHEIDVIKLNRCADHFYHLECLTNYIQNHTGFKCAVCQKIYGVIIGDMPPGKMVVNVNQNLRCAGYPDCATIILKYEIYNGQKNGKNFSGTYRTNYIPNTKNGRILLGLLKIAFDRKLTFTIGTSVTTGQKNTVVWNGIHHKSSTSGGPSNYGYPDPTYFNRVTEELASKGVNKDDYSDNELEFLGLNLMYLN